MSNNKQDKDIFTHQVGKIKPLKKSNKNFEKLNLINIQNPKQNSLKKKPSNIILNTKLETNFIKDSPTSFVKSNINTKISSIEKKIKKGKLPFDKKVDFHGLSSENAKRIFFKTITDCFYSNNRCILFITGKGLKKSIHDTANTRLFYSKIREDFQKWVLEKNIVSKILYVQPAGFLHGGDGAFFVYLRKNKD